jgi:autotransporter-associated beta strand protein
LVWDAPITGSGDFTKFGEGRFVITGDNSAWSGDITIRNGTLRAIASNALGTGSFASVESGATLEIEGGISLAQSIELDGGTLASLSGNNTVESPVLLRSSSTIDVQQDSLTLSDSISSNVGNDSISFGDGVTADLTLAGFGDFTLLGSLDLGGFDSTAGDVNQVGAGVARYKSPLNVESVRSTGGGTIWMDQPSESEVLSSGSSIFLSNGSILRRDGSETLDDTSLELGEGGGGISVGDGFSLVWDAPITGSGDFTKFGEGVLTFPESADIEYSGDTFVREGSLEVFSSLPASAACSGTGTSSLCNSGVIELPGGGENGGDDNIDLTFPQPPISLEGTSNPRSDKEDDQETLGEFIDSNEELVGATTETIALLPVDQPATFSGSSSPILQVDLVSANKASASETSGSTQVPLISVNTQTIGAEQASAQLQQSDQVATSRTATFLGLNKSDQSILPSTPTVGDLQIALRRVQREGSIDKPGILHVRFTKQADGALNDSFLDLTLVGADAPVQSRRVPLKRDRFASLLTVLYRQLSRQEPLATDDPASPSRQLHALLVAPILESLLSQDVETLLIAADQGLQAVPFAALSDGSSFFGEKYAFALTPSLALTPLAPFQSDSGVQLALGASEFETLAPLPLVPQELEQLGASTGADRYLNEEFSPQVLLNGAADQRYDRVHVATHADFRPGGPAQSLLHTGTGPMPMEQLAQLRSKRLEPPLDLIVLSACRTLLGDPDSELGFAGLALQAGARSAVGTLWYVDDVVTSAFFVQFYRLLDQGFPKADALLRTRQMFATGAIQLQGDAVVGPGEAPLLTGLSSAQRLRVAGGVQNPYFWAGIQLIGSPW